MVDFAGWSMPVHYSSIVAEHRATRSEIGVFDISHMGRFRVSGSDASAYLDSILTRRIVDLRAGRICYSLVCNQDGGILDDILVYCTADERGEYFLLVVNASNREKIFGWMHEHFQGLQVELDDVTERTAMIAVQGPAATKLIVDLAQRTHDGAGCAELKYYRCMHSEMDGVTLLLSRTGYTGEDGFELILPSDTSLGVWTSILERGSRLGACAAGLGARDTLRLEAAMPLYGHELSEGINPFQAGLEFAVNLEQRDFVGHAALVRLHKDKDQPRRVGLELSGKRLPRESYRIFAKNEDVGVVTSGTFSPTLAFPIAMGYVAPGYATIGSPLEVDIRGQRVAARVVELPFYRRPK